MQTIQTHAYSVNCLEVHGGTLYTGSGDCAIHASHIQACIPRTDLHLGHEGAMSADVWKNSATKAVLGTFTLQQRRLGRSQGRQQYCY